jgi:hypothetical protein
VKPTLEVLKTGGGGKFNADFMTSNSTGRPYVGQSIETKNSGETPKKLASFLIGSGAN